MKDIAWLSDLKLRAGYGRVGNQDIGNQDNQNIADVASLGLYQPNYGTLYNNGVGFPGQWLNVGTAYDLSGANGGTLPSGFVSVQAANRGLKWEQTEEVNIGVDFSLVDDKIYGSFDYFTSKDNGHPGSTSRCSGSGRGKNKMGERCHEAEQRLRVGFRIS